MSSTVKKSSFNKPVVLQTTIFIVSIALLGLGISSLIGGIKDGDGLWITEAVIGLLFVVFVLIVSIRWSLYLKNQRNLTNKINNVIQRYKDYPTSSSESVE